LDANGRNDRKPQKTSLRYFLEFYCVLLSYKHKSYVSSCHKALYLFCHCLSVYNVVFKHWQNQLQPADSQICSSWSSVDCYVSWWILLERLLFDQSANTAAIKKVMINKYVLATRIINVECKKNSTECILFSRR
jgi:hypothetical protein